MASLGNDLATIREQQGKTLEDIHDATKIPLHLLKAIEDGSIFTEFDENKTYIRSYIRSYGKALGIKDRYVVDALDHYELGTYDGQLLERVNIEKSPPEFTFDEHEHEEEDDQDTIEYSSPEDTEPEEDRAQTNIQQSTGRSATDVQRASEHQSDPPSVNSVDWADLGRKFTPLENRSPVWIGAAIVLLILSGVIGYWLYQNRSFDGFQDREGTPNTAQELSPEPGIVPDSLQLNLSDSEDTTVAQPTSSSPLQQMQSMESLPDTLYLAIYAAYERLEPVRVYSDVMQNFNPYWIEQGQAYRFEFTDFIRIQGQLSRMELLMNGHPIENFSERFLTAVNPDSQYVEITRSLFEGDEQWLQPPPDSTALNFSPPSSVVDRPTFPSVQTN